MSRNGWIKKSSQTFWFLNPKKVLPRRIECYGFAQSRWRLGMACQGSVEPRTRTLRRSSTALSCSPALTAIQLESPPDQPRRSTCQSTQSARHSGPGSRPSVRAHVTWMMTRGKEPTFRYCDSCEVASSMEQHHFTLQLKNFEDQFMRDP